MLGPVSPFGIAKGAIAPTSFAFLVGKNHHHHISTYHHRAGSPSWFCRNPYCIGVVARCHRVVTCLVMRAQIGRLEAAAGSPGGRLLLPGMECIQLSRKDVAFPSVAGRWLPDGSVLGLWMRVPGFRRATLPESLGAGLSLKRIIVQKPSLLFNLHQALAVIRTLSKASVGCFVVFQYYRWH